jgi:hypothetical protein
LILIPIFQKKAKDDDAGMGRWGDLSVVRFYRQGLTFTAEN